MKKRVMKNMRDVLRIERGGLGKNDEEVGEDEVEMEKMFY